ncbi:DUF882 domain-containing protein [Acuticoccus yangtzensis]|uniref:DUF882 domain-containing protein n=1 Tax=Acuticoccus yangtzensis TaxID=1443441 RepID=UPI0009495D55|nr:DUF882 domain-containing protein [Acuticoccus yangtzensis]
MPRCGDHTRRLQRLRSAGLAAILSAVMLGTGGVSEASAQARTLKLYFTHTRESIEIVYKRNGSYVGSALRDLNRFLRDWRRNEATKMDPELFDLLWEMQQEFGGGTINVVSAYRSPATNAMLRSRSRGVAKTSQHMAGRAIDFYIKGANLAKLRAAGMKRQVGGVGYYPTSGSPFVHMDTGSVRAWPRMSRAELTRVFPDGKTLHLPSDGKPLAGYAEAQRLEKEGKLTKLRDGGGGGGNIFAALFSGGSGGADEEGDDETITPAARTRRPTETRRPTQVAAVRRPDPAPAAPSRPANNGNDGNNSGNEGGGFFRQLPSVSLGGLIGRSRDETPAEQPSVQPVALPDNPLTAVATEPAPAPAAVPTPPPAPTPAPPPEVAEPVEDRPIIVAALPPQRPAPRRTPAEAPAGIAAREASGTADDGLGAAATALGYARDEGTIGTSASPQSAVAAIIPRPADVGAPSRRPELRAAPTGGAPATGAAAPAATLAAAPSEPAPQGLTGDAVAALMTPIYDADPVLISNRSDLSGQDFADLVAPDRRTAAADGVLLAQGFLGSAKPIGEGGTDWLDTDRFTGTRVTVFASPRS